MNISHLDHNRQQYTNSQRRVNMQSAQGSSNNRSSFQNNVANQQAQGTNCRNEQACGKRLNIIA
jgi:hypothetical protein